MGSLVQAHLADFDLPFFWRLLSSALVQRLRAVLMDEGVIVEEAPPDRFFTAPEHPRTRQFLSKIL